MDQIITLLELVARNVWRFLKDQCHPTQGPIFRYGLVPASRRTDPAIAPQPEVTGIQPAVHSPRIVQVNHSVIAARLNIPTAMGIASGTAGHKKPAGRQRVYKSEVAQEELATPCPDSAAIHVNEIGTGVFSNPTRVTCKSGAGHLADGTRIQPQVCRHPLDVKGIFCNAAAASA